MYIPSTLRDKILNLVQSQAYLEARSLTDSEPNLFSFEENDENRYSLIDMLRVCLEAKRYLRFLRSYPDSETQQIISRLLLEDVSDYHEPTDTHLWEEYSKPESNQVENTFVANSDKIHAKWFSLKNQISELVSAENKLRYPELYKDQSNVYLP